MNSTVVDRVSRGVSWLDENVPGWYNRIDLGKFNIAHSDSCVLGQLEGNFWDFLFVQNKSVDWMINHGFGGDGLTPFCSLQEEWERAIRLKRTQ